MKLSIIIPVYNEEKTISKVIRRVKDAKLGNVKKEVIRLDKEVDLKKAGKHISPQEFLEVYKSL